MFDTNRTSISCQNALCARQGEPFAFLYLGAGDTSRVVCPTCGWVSTIRVGEDGRHRTECRAGAPPEEKRQTPRARRSNRTRSA